MEYTAQFTYDCLWRVDGEKRVCTGGHESDGYPWFCKTVTFFISTNINNEDISQKFFPDTYDHKLMLDKN